MKRIKILAAAAIITFLAVGCTSAKTSNTAGPSKEKKVTDSPSVLYVKKDVKLPEYFNVKSKNVYENLTIVYPDKDRGAGIVARAIAADIRKNKQSESKIMKESEVKKSDLNSSNIMIIGNIVSSALLSEIKEILPVYADGEKIVAGSKTYTGKEYGVTYFYPNLYNYNYSMIFVMGNSETAYKMYNFAGEDIFVYKGTPEISHVNFKEIAYGKFNKDWKVERIGDVDPKLLDTGENNKLEVGEIKDYKFPEWAKGKVIYEIFVRSFYDSNGDGRGDLKGIEAKLDYLQEIGADVLWLMPVFESSSYHGYDVRNYFAIAKDYGTNEEFRSLAQAVHKRGMRIIFDLPLNHLSRQSSYFRDAYNNPESKYDKWFYFANIQNTIYHDWYFRDNPERRENTDSEMPAWNTNNPDVISFHAEIAKFWFDPNNDGDMSDGVDGYRLDYAKGPSHEYWKMWRQKVKAIKPDAFLIAELWISKEEVFPYFDDQFDSAFDFDFQGAATTGVMKDIGDTLAKEDKSMNANAEMARFLSNHDMDRFPTYKKPFELKIYSTMMYTLPGMPTLYYGDELGLKGDKGESNGDEGRRRPMEWYKENKGPGMAKWIDVYEKKADGISVEEQKGQEGSLLEHYKKLAQIRKENLSVLNEGKRVDVRVYEIKDGKEGLAKKIKAYFMVKDGKKILTVVNLGKEGEYIFDFSGSVEGKESLVEILNNDKEIEIEKGKVALNLKATTPYIYKSK